MPARSPPETAGPEPAGPPVLVCALSGRALAAAAVRAGYRPLVIDAFADADTMALAAAARRVPLAAFRRGPALAEAAATLPAGLPVAYGAGFEGRPDRLAALAAGRTLAGNPPAAVRAVRHPETFFATLARLGIPHPETRRTPPGDGTGWLVKRPGGSGGLHVRPAAPGGRAGGRGGVIFQRCMPGRPLSVQVLGDAAGARVLAVTAGWCDPAPGRPHRFGGLAGPVAPPPRLATALAAAAVAAVEAFGLRGLCSVDFVATGDAAWLLEVNPRPGAALDVLAGDPHLFARHLAAFGAAPPPPDLETAPAPSLGAPLAPRAVAVVYARRALTVPARFAWPAWTADRPAPGTAVPAGAPLCTATAHGATAAQAAGLARARAARLLSTLDPAAGAWRPPPSEDRHDHHPAP